MRGSHALPRRLRHLAAALQGQAAQSYKEMAASGIMSSQFAAAGGYIPASAPTPVRNSGDVSPFLRHANRARAPLSALGREKALLSSNSSGLSAGAAEFVPSRARF